MIPQNLNNPFVSPKLDDTSSLPPGNVPELHANILTKFTSMLSHAKQSQQGIGLLVVGEAGSGKSHLIAQWRQQLAQIPTAVLASISLKGAFSGRLWRHVRERLVTELLREYPNSEHGANGLLRILKNRFPTWAQAAHSSSGGLLAWLVGKSQPKTDLQPFLTEAAKQYPLQYQFQKVLPKVGNPDLSDLAHEWLRGQQLGGEDLEKLGLPPTYPSEQDQEVVARDVVLSLLRLARDRTICFLCFDEVEAIQSSNWDAAVLREFTTLVTDLVGESGPRVVATFIRPNLKVDIDKSVEVSNVQKISQFSVNIPQITWEQMLRIVLVRLNAELSCQAVRVLHTANPYWPLENQFLDQTFQANKRTMTPRHAILACAVEFQRLQNGEGGGPIPHGEDFAKGIEKQRKKFRNNIQSVKVDSAMGIALPWLVELMDLPFDIRNTSGSQYGDFSMLFEPKTGKSLPLAISFCSQDPKSLWHKLDKLISLWDTMKGVSLQTLVIMRSVDASTPKGSVERLDKLRAAGAQVIMVSTEELAEVAAYQAMFTAAASGDLTRSGTPVERSDYSLWAKDNLSDLLKGFVQKVFPLSTSSAPTAVVKPPKAPSQPPVAPPPPVVPPPPPPVAAKKPATKPAPKPKK